MEKQKEPAGLKKSKKQHFRHLLNTCRKKITIVKREIQEIKKKFNYLTRRTSPQIKTWLYNKQKVARAA